MPERIARNSRARCASSRSGDAHRSAAAGARVYNGRSVHGARREGEARVREIRRPGFWGSMPRWMKLLIGVGVIAVIVAALAGTAAWNLWFRYDDASDIQGVWASSAGSTIVITNDQLQLSDSVAYDYTIDTQRKTIDFSFGNARGHASYRFNSDRTKLVLDEAHDTNYLMLLGIVNDDELDAGTTGNGVSVLTRQGSYMGVSGAADSGGSSDANASGQ